MRYLVKERLPDGREHVLGRGLTLTDALSVARTATWATTIAEEH